MQHPQQERPLQLWQDAPQWQQHGRASATLPGPQSWGAGTAASPEQRPEAARLGKADCAHRFCDACRLELPSNLRLAAAHFASEGHLLRCGVSNEQLQAAWGGAAAAPPEQRSRASTDCAHRVCDVCQLQLPSDLRDATAHFASEGHLLRCGVAEELQAAWGGEAPVTHGQQSIAPGAVAPAPPPQAVPLTQPPLPNSPPPPLPPGSPPPSVIKLDPAQGPGVQSGKLVATVAAAASPCPDPGPAGTAARREAAAAIPTKSSLVPEFLKAVWSAMSPCKSRPTSGAPPNQPPLLGVSARASQVQAAPASGMAATSAHRVASSGQEAGRLKDGEILEASQRKPAAAATKATPKASVALASSSACRGSEGAQSSMAPARVEELEEGEIPIPGPGAVPAGAAAAAGTPSAPAISTCSATLATPAAVYIAEVDQERVQLLQRGSPGSSRGSPGPGRKKEKGSKVMAALRRTLRRGRNKKEAASRKPAKLDRSTGPQVVSLAASLAQQAQQLREQLASLSLVPASSGDSGVSRRTGEDASPRTPSGDVEGQLSALSSQLSQLTLCLQSIQGAGAGNPFALSLAPSAPQQTSNLAAKVFVIFDTNVLLDYLGDTREWWARLQAAGPACSHVMLLMPLAVIRELDGLKNSFRHYFSARRAISFVHEKLLGNTQYRGQREGELHRGLCRRGDDGILDCCLYFHDRGAQVEVVTHDRNLQLRVANEGMIYHTHSTALAAFPRWQLGAQLQRQQQQQGVQAVAGGKPRAALGAAKDMAVASKDQPAAASSSSQPAAAIPSSRPIAAAPPSQPAAAPQVPLAQQQQPRQQPAGPRESGQQVVQEEGLAELLATYASPAPGQLPHPPLSLPKPVPALQEAAPLTVQEEAAQAQQRKPHYQSGRQYQRGMHSGRSFFWETLQARQGKEN